jgi:hypothetical protein
LVIYAWKGKSLDLDSLSTSNPDYEITKVNGEPAFYGSVGGIADEHLFLWWEQDGLYYQMYYYQYFGLTINKEKLIAIAESLQDINDFRPKDSRPYEYVSIYEQALGFDAREFPETPAQWVFDNVWGDIYGRCITLFYKSVAEPSWLMLTQCGTDRYYNASDIPSHMTQQVQIGEKKAIYAKGDFVTNDNGDLLWDPDLPVHQLFWQENGLWMEIQINGERGQQYSQADLISYAESLR